MIRTRRTMLVLLWLSAFALSLGLATPVFADPRGAGSTPFGSQSQTNNALPPILEEVGIEDKPGAVVPRDVTLTGSDGRSFIAGEYMDGEKPLVLVLAYYRCPMLCSMVIRGMDKAIGKMTKHVGKDYRVLVVSFDPRDTTEIAKAKRANYLDELGQNHDVASYEFATGSEAEVRRLADSVGFHYKWDASQQQYAHAAGLFVITPKGKLSQTFTGIEFAPDDVDRAVAEADKEVWHSPLKSALLYCFSYDPKHGRYVPIVMNIMKIGAALTIAVVGFVIYRLFRIEKKKSARGLISSNSSTKALT